MSTSQQKVMQHLAAKRAKEAAEAARLAAVVAAKSTAGAGSKAAKADVADKSKNTIAAPPPSRKRPLPIKEEATEAEVAWDPDTTGGSSSSSSGSSTRVIIRKRATQASAARPGSSSATGSNGAGGRGSTEDFQRALLQWDILSELRAEVTDTRRAYEGAHAQQFADIRVPDHFSSFAAYLAVWQPLCLREVRAQTLNGLISDSPSGDPAEVCLRQAVMPDAGSDISCMDMQVVNGGAGGSSSGNRGGRGSGMSSLFGNELLLITKHKTTLSELLGLARQSDRSSNSNGSNSNSSNSSYTATKPYTSGILGICVTGARTREGLRIIVHRRAVAALQDGSNGGTAYAYNLGSIIGSLREWDALNSMDRIPLVKEILNTPEHELQQQQKQQLLLSSALAQETSSSSGSGSGSGSGSRPIRATLSTSAGASELAALMPSAASEHSKGVGAVQLGSAFVSWMEGRFNASQKRAIAAAAADEGFTLIKGPPGTGKTTTLTALLNALHVREYNRYYAAILALARASSAVDTEEAWAKLRRQKPHILVTAPSNAGVDNVVQRILSDGFLDGGGGKYYPPIVRVGRGAGQAAKAVSLDEQVDTVTRLSNTDLHSRVTQLSARSAVLRGEVSTAVALLKALVTAAPMPLPPHWEVRVDPNTCVAYFVDHKRQRTQTTFPDAAQYLPTAAAAATTAAAAAKAVKAEEQQQQAAGEQDGTVAVESMPEYTIYAGQLTRALEEFENVRMEGTRLQSAIRASTDTGNAQLRVQIEAQVLDSAHIVFTTLNSAAMPCLQGTALFTVVVVDEAAQGVEPATLVPLRLGGRHCVLVGDPQQLSATVFSQGGAAAQYDRSLFQRLEQCGHAVHLLDTQYRMHPRISAFPRAAFYDSKLQDGPNVMQPVYTKDYHKYKAFQPFVFMNMHGGTSQRAAKSLSNPSEAALAVNVYTTLCKLVPSAASLRGTVGIITPYAEQLGELRRAFQLALGPSYTSAVEIATVDGFQGREKEVIIVSLVRASGAGGVGFLADVRRMNVALTRAKYGLYVIGHEATLKSNSMWAALMQQARAAGAFLDVAAPTVDLLQEFGLVGDTSTAAAAAAQRSKVKAEPEPEEPGEVRQQGSAPLLTTDDDAAREYKPNVRPKQKPRPPAGPPPPRPTVSVKEEGEIDELPLTMLPPPRKKKAKKNSISGTAAATTAAAAAASVKSEASTTGGAVKAELQTAAVKAEPESAVAAASVKAELPDTG